MARNYRVPRGKSMRIPAKYSDLVEKYCQGSAGPRPNITGMRLHYWGTGPIIRCGQYAYLMSEEDYSRFLYLAD